MSLHGLQLLMPPGIKMATLNNLPPLTFHYDDLDGDDINTQRLRERWHTWASPNGVYDPELDWILNGRDDMTFGEWQDAEKPLAVHSHLILPQKKQPRRETLMDYL